jgi:hypothetical protein
MTKIQKNIHTLLITPLVCLFIYFLATAWYPDIVINGNSEATSLVLSISIRRDLDSDCIAKTRFRIILDKDNKLVHTKFYPVETLIVGTDKVQQTYNNGVIHVTMDGHKLNFVQNIDHFLVEKNVKITATK